jgi:hypothetical protein
MKSKLTYLLALLGVLALVAAPVATAEGRADPPQLDQVREATARFHDVNEAEAAGYAQFLDCVAMTGSSTGLQVDATQNQTPGQAIAAGADQRIARREAAEGTAQQGPLTPGQAIAAGVDQRIARREAAEGKAQQGPLTPGQAIAAGADQRIARREAAEGAAQQWPLTPGQAIAAGVDQRIARREAAAGAAQQGPLTLPSTGGMPGRGAIGVQFVNGKLAGDALLDPLQPEALLYEPNGKKLALTGVEYVVMADAWRAAGHASPPSLFGQTFNFTDSPNMFGLPTFYSLQAWVWKSNPSGPFAAWNPAVSCPTSLGSEPLRTVR